MAFRFRKQFKILPGIKVTLSKRSIGVTAGVRGAHVSINTKGRITRTVGVPGTGLSDVNISNTKNKSTNN
jgi:hypothetical protein